MAAAAPKPVWLETGGQRRRAGREEEERQWGRGPILMLPCVVVGLLLGLVLVTLQAIALFQEEVGGGGEEVGKTMFGGGRGRGGYTGYYSEKATSASNVVSYRSTPATTSTSAATTTRTTTTSTPQPIATTTTIFISTSTTTFSATKTITTANTPSSSSTTSSIESMELTCEEAQLYLKGSFIGTIPWTLSAYDCWVGCDDTPDCDFFVWQGDGSPGKDCHMLKSSTAPAPSPHFNVQGDSCECFEVNTYYWGTDVGYAPHVASPAECQTLCQDTDSCFFWNYATDSSWAPKACFLKGFVESKSRIKKLFSGPKFCS